MSAAPLDMIASNTSEVRGTSARHRPRRRTVTVAAVLALAGLVGVWFYRRAEARDVPTYRLATIERGNLERTVSATGTLNALKTVQVGTQVSGQVAQIYVDFNDRVKRGQLLARIDPTLQQQAVLDAQAGLERSEAELVQARREHSRNAQMYDSRVLAAARGVESRTPLATPQTEARCRARCLTQIPGPIETQPRLHPATSQAATALPRESLGRRVGRRRSDRLRPRLPEQSFHVIVLGLPEIVVVDPDGAERLGGREADHLVRFVPERRGRNPTVA
jgi:hypothetical protein